METTEKKLPKATPEIVKEYDELQQKLKGLGPSWIDKEANAVWDRINELEQNYDWFNVEFADPITGKKGLKTIAGEVIAPALYDGFYEYHNYVFSPHAPVIAIKNGKCGIVKGDGSGQQLCEFKFDAICSVIFSSLFRAYWGGVEDRFGIITATGDIICPNILTRIDEPFNTLLPIGTDDKTGCAVLISMVEELIELLLIGTYIHCGAGEHIGRPNENRVADSVDEFLHIVHRGQGAPFRLVNTDTIQHSRELIAILGIVNRFR